MINIRPFPFADVLSGDIGLAISSAMMLSGMFQWGVRQSAEVENQMTSVERVVEYSKLEPEASLETEKGWAIIFCKRFYAFRNIFHWVYIGYVES